MPVIPTVESNVLGMAERQYDNTAADHRRKYWNREQSVGDERDNSDKVHNESIESTSQPHTSSRGMSHIIEESIDDGTTHTLFETQRRQPHHHHPDKWMFFQPSNKRHSSPSQMIPKSDIKPPPPSLPPRPSTSACLRAKSSAAADVPCLRENTPKKDRPVRSKSLSGLYRPSGRKQFHALNLHECPTTYPDFSIVNRQPPCHKPTSFATHHRGSIRAIAANSGNRIATASHTIRFWDSSKSCHSLGTFLPSLAPLSNSSQHNHNEAVMGTEKISALAFQCKRYLWAGMDDGQLMVLDTMAQRIVANLYAHEHAITFILRIRNTELWTIDSQGVLLRWPVSAVSEDDIPDMMMAHDGYCHKVTPAAVAAAVVVQDGKKQEEDDRVLWITSGRTLDVYRFAPCNSRWSRETVSRPDHVVCIPSELGNITQLAGLSRQGTTFLVCGHADGNVTVWDTETWKLVQLVTVSMYGISAMVITQDRYLWAGFRTGMMYVYDLAHSWTVVKMWDAHQAPIVKMVVDDPSSLVLTEAGKEDNVVMQVVSADSRGDVAVWDGLLKDVWKDEQMQKRAAEYCSYRDARIMICSWNIDACMPDDLDQRDRNGVQGWLKSMDDPDIIVVGLQEIVDLESKRQTARSIFAKRKKQEQQTIQDNPTLTRQYGAWREFIANVISSNYKDRYTLVKTDHLVGLFSCVFIKTSEQHRVQNVHSTVVKTGLRVMNKCWHGNKGAVAIRLTMDHASICFVNCHLAAGQSRVQQRNSDVEDVFHNARFPAMAYPVRGGDGSLVLDHEHCFVSGDLNYRLDKWKRQEVLEWLQQEPKRMAYQELLAEDQLIKQRTENPLFKLLTFKEAPIFFDPTYKYNVGQDRYDTSEKQRVPAWCDRVLFRSHTAENLFYKRHEVRASDHRPISAGFRVQIKIVSEEKRRAVSTALEAQWRDQRLPQIIVKAKARYVTDFERCTENEAYPRLGSMH